MSRLEEMLVGLDQNVEEIIGVIEASESKCVVVVDENRKLLGTVTDGDIRRAFLRGVPISASCSEVMHQEPRVGSIQNTAAKHMSMMNAVGVRFLPLVDEDGVVQSVVLLDELMDTKRKDNWVVLMAGGRGSRLMPLTNAKPKPLLTVGTKPILETILESFIEHGFHNFFISVNYKAEMIRGHFGDGSKWDVEIRYLEEDEPLGTGGALSLLPDEPSLPVILMNGDILTNVNWHDVLRFHEECSDLVTMCVREFTLKIPFGVIEFDDHRVMGIHEKPEHNHFVNAGIYVINPEVVQRVPENTFMNITDVFEPLMGQKPGVSAFLINEYWMDIGRIDDFSKANEEFFDVFQ